MQIEKKVFSKLFKPKTALSRKVDLALVSELEQALDLASDGYSHAFDGFQFMNNIESKIIDLRLEINREIKDFFNSGRALELADDVDNLQTLFNELISKTDELGIDPAILFPRIEAAMTVLDKSGQISTDFRGAYNRVIDESNIGLINFMN